MAVYDADGNALQAVYDGYGVLLNTAYDAEGNLIFQSGGIPWVDEISVEKKRDTSANTNYYVIRIPQTRSDGTKQYPFVYAPNGSGAGTQSTLEMNLEKGFEMAINAGLFYGEGTYSYGTPLGLTIENGVLIAEYAKESNTLPPLTIDENGNLNYAEVPTDGQTLINNGIVSAVNGFNPLVVNHVSVDESVYKLTTNWNTGAQRQIIGQYDNGDYCIITGEGRNFDSSTGFTIPQAIAVCLSLGLKFAYNLDGGGSTETVIGDEQLNVIYEETTGRVVPTYIVFNGTDRFFIPSEQNS